MYEFNDDFGAITENTVAAAGYYFKTNNIKVVVIGMSGGMDSALVAALIHEIKKHTDIKLVGMILDIESKPAEIQRGTEIASAFCDETIVRDLTELYHQVAPFIMSSHKSPDFDEKIRKGNLKARLRMCQLYDMARALGGIVLSTDNYTEYLLGFWTLHGDVGDFGMIQNLWKSEVYGVGRYLVSQYEDSFRGKAALQSAIDALPTDGLGVSNSDFDQICPEQACTTPEDTYRYVDTILLDYLKSADKPYPTHIDTKIVQRNLNTEFKRNNPFNLSRSAVTRRRT